MPGITSNEPVTENIYSNSNYLDNIKNSIINIENDTVLYYSSIIFISLSFIILFIIYKKGKRSIKKCK